ncbi:YopX family protein, partial [Streptococcus pneumoniae]|nr:YopX family protein [Streptococcus pneumoniae]
ENGLPDDRDIYCYTPDEIELMQSTGLKDKNGKEVFIGDIVKCTRGCPHEVYLEKEYGGTYIGGMPAIYLKGLLSGYAWTEDEEIIGNIYENPELLEDKE